MIDIQQEEHKLTLKQQKFIDYYIETGNAAESARRAGYSLKTAYSAGHDNLKKPYILKEIQRRQREMSNARIASAQEVMEYLTKVMNGEIKDQFGLEASLAERTKAAQELARRTVDIENRARGAADTVVQIKLDWSRDK